MILLLSSLLINCLIYQSTCLKSLVIDDEFHESLCESSDVFLPLLNRCLKLIDLKLSHADASQICKNFDGNLPSFFDEAEVYRTKKLFASKNEIFVWTGATYENGTIEWEDNNEVENIEWHKDFFNQKSGKQCVFLSSKSLQFQIDDCEARKYFLCALNYFTCDKLKYKVYTQSSAESITKIKEEEYDI